MLSTRNLMTSLAACLLATAALAQAPGSAPAGSNGLCRDGSYSSSATKKGACRGHKGVQDWYSADAAGGGSAATMSAKSAAPAPAAAPQAARTAPATPATPPAASTGSAAAAPKAMNPATVPAAAGGGNGQVWVNSSSKVYHCSTDRWYGKTKNGTYMTEADAIAKGNHADHGKACGKS